MNLRTLKKLSKRAAPMLPILGDMRKQFRAAHHLEQENYAGCVINARKHWERSSCHSSYTGRDGEIVFTTRSGRTRVMRSPSHPRKGTVMVGATTGYYEPEWDEETAWDALSDYVYAHFTDWSVEKPVATRRIENPRDVFAAANEIITSGGACG